MLYAALVLASIQLLIVNLARRPSTRYWSVIGSGVALFGLACLGAVFPVLLLQSLFLLIAAGIWHLARRGRWWFLPLLLAASLLAFGLVSWSALVSQARLRDEFPLESLAGRLPEPGPALHSGPLPAVGASRLLEFEKDIEKNGNNSFRTYLLKELHEQTVRSFVNSPGFGVTRMPFLSEGMLKHGLREEGPPVDQPGAREAVPWSPGGAAPLPEEDEKQLYQTHLGGELDFVNPRGFGYVTDRRRVAGLQSHQFSSVPEPTQHWAVQTIDLVSLLLHDPPVTYVSAHLPRMNELRDAPTRPMDEFEALSLSALRQGEDLIASRGGNRVRVLGALRSTKTCVGCHGGERGDLLGAFSYVLGPAALKH